MALEVRLLGPLEVVLHGRPVRLTGRLRTLLLVLAMSAGKAVSVFQLAEALWGERLPANPRASVQTYITRLRETLGAELISTSPPGYALTADVDADRFLELLENDDDRQGLSEALSLWRGIPFEGTQSDWLEGVEGPRLLERYLAATERAVDLDLRDGRHSEWVAPLRRLLAEHPLRESLAERLMLVLERSGRRAEALDLYESVRRLIAGELGADPGKVLRDLHTHLLADPEPEKSAQLVVVPRQLPPDLGGGGFAGREAELSTLDESRSAVAVIGGAAGIGKTALALHWAHRVKEDFPDGQLYVNLRGFDPSGEPMPAAEAVRGFLDALGVGPDRVPTGLEAQTGLYRSLTAGKRMLILLDNARDAEQVRPLLPSSPESLCLVTSRDQLLGLVAGSGARPVMLSALPQPAARHLLESRLGAQRVSEDPWAAYRIIERCAGLPLALAIVAARAALHPEFPLEMVAAQLDQGLPADVGTVFSWSYHTLGPDTARLFRALGLHGGPDFAAPAAASLAAVTPAQAATALHELAAAHLLIERTPGRYTFHDLLRAYAIELTHEHDPDHAREAAVGRVLDHYAHSAHHAAERLDPIRRSPALEAPPAGVTVVESKHRDAAMEWFVTEQQVLLRAVETAVAKGFDRQAIILAWALFPFLDLRGHWDDALVSQNAALRAALRVGDLAVEADVHRWMVRALLRLDMPREAEKHLRRALEIAIELDDSAARARAHHLLAGFYERQGRYSDALREVQLELEHFTASGQRRGQATALNGVGWFHAKLGDHRAALRYCRQALELHHELGNLFGQASTWDSLGFAHENLGEHRQALECYEHSLALYHRLGDRFGTADTLVRIGDAHRAAGDTDPAVRAWRRALEILNELGHADAVKVSHKLTALTTPA
ncbi:MAG TPA: BTAD domain-containing putative transcriptional regulator [Candidatus Limnocylindrales bacterium]|nr:BTAD domain-containing putative transcriptional regulator [Candidatus Limnocylindrales bacterium]